MMDKMPQCLEALVTLSPALDDGEIFSLDGSPEVEVSQGVWLSYRFSDALREAPLES